MILYRKYIGWRDNDFNVYAYRQDVSIDVEGRIERGDGGWGDGVRVGQYPIVTPARQSLTVELRYQKPTGSICFQLPLFTGVTIGY